MKKWTRKTGTVRSFGVCFLDYESIVRYIGAERHSEDDPLNTHSGRELFWLFEISSDSLLAFRYHEVSKELYVGTNNSIESVTEVLNMMFPIKFDFSEGVLWD